MSKPIFLKEFRDAGRVVTSQQELDRVVYYKEDASALDLVRGGYISFGETKKVANTKNMKKGSIAAEDKKGKE